MSKFLAVCMRAVQGRPCDQHLSAASGSDTIPTLRNRGVQRYCRNCLARSHLAPDCTCLTGCRRCDYRHHTLLHGAPQLDDTIQPAPRFTWDLVFIPTALVRAIAENGDTWKTVRALICQSSLMSRIAYSTFQGLGLRSVMF